MKIAKEIKTLKNSKKNKFFYNFNAKNYILCFELKKNKLFEHAKQRMINHTLGIATFCIYCFCYWSNCEFVKSNNLVLWSKQQK